MDKEIFAKLDDLEKKVKPVRFGMSKRGTKMVLRAYKDKKDILGVEITPLIGKEEMIKHIDYYIKNPKKLPHNLSESYKLHYPSLKKLTQLQYTDPRINTENKKIHIEKEGNFRRGGENIHGHYIVYEDKGMAGSYIAVHISSDINEDTGEAQQISVVAIDKNRSSVVNRVSYRMRQSKIVEAEVVEESE